MRTFKIAKKIKQGYYDWAKGEQILSLFETEKGDIVAYSDLLTIGNTYTMYISIYDGIWFAS